MSVSGLPSSVNIPLANDSRLSKKQLAAAVVLTSAAAAAALALAYAPGLRDAFPLGGRVILLTGLTGAVLVGGHGLMKEAYLSEKKQLETPPFKSSAPAQTIGNRRQQALDNKGDTIYPL